VFCCTETLQQTGAEAPRQLAQASGWGIGRGSDEERKGRNNRTSGRGGGRNHQVERSGHVDAGVRLQQRATERRGGNGGVSEGAEGAEAHGAVRVERGQVGVEQRSEAAAVGPHERALVLLHSQPDHCSHHRQVHEVVVHLPLFKGGRAGVRVSHHRSNVKRN
jgi:hypothetical protein